MSEVVLEKNNELPKGWIMGIISDVALNPKNDIVDGPFGSNLKSTEYVDQGIPIIRLQNVSRYQFINKNIRYVTKEKAEQLKRHSFLKNDIVMTKLGVPVGKACLVPEFLESGIIVADILRMRVAEKFISKQFILYLINSNFIIKQFAYNTKGTTRPRVNLTKFRDFLIPIPPLNEQKRIVSKIEELFSKIDSVKQSLEYTKLQLEQYRQSLLKSAFEGKLMKIENNKIKFIPLNEIGSIITGYTPKTSNSSFYGNDIPFFKPKDLNKGYFVNNSKDKLSTKGIQKARLVPEKSVLVTSIGATIGKTGFSRIEGVTNQQINSIIPDSNQILPEFLYFLCISPQFQESILNNASSTTLPIINKSKFSKLEIPLFSIKEQEQMVSQIEQGFSLIENTSQIVKYSLQNLQTMKMSVLKKVFEGKLVPQDPNDEPASVLLQKIKHEKEQLIQKQNTSKVKKNVK